MIRFSLDASALLPLFAPDIHTEKLTTWLVSAPRSLIVSDFASAEASASISRRVRMGLIDTGLANEALAKLDAWVSRTATRRLTSAGDIASCERLVRRFELKLQAPDALHIAIALADGATLVTFDGRQARAMAGLGACVVPARERIL